MGLFDIMGSRKKDWFESRLFQLHNLLRASFWNVKRDTTLIFQWLNYFNQKVIQQDHFIAELKKELFLIPKKEEIKRIIGETYEYEDIINRLNYIEKRLNTVALPATQDIFELQKRLERLEQKKQSIKEKLIRRITKNSKDYVKSIILSLIKKYEKISALQIKEMIVEEQGLCSKSSFYRLLEEIEDLEEVGVIRKGKEKHYVVKLTKQT